MTGEQYTQIKRPVSRLTEKVLGWLSWVFLLILTIVTMFIALVSFSNDTSIANLENTLNNNDLIQQVLANNSLSTTQFVIWLQNGVWAIIVYFIVCLLISFLALISMNIRILSGFLFLLSAIITIPLVLLVVTLIIPILFFIIAIMMFVRKNKVETVPSYYNGGYGYQPYEEMPEQEAHAHHSKLKVNQLKSHNSVDVHHVVAWSSKEQAFDTTTGSTDQIQNEQESYDDKYEQFPKRAVESEYRSDDNEHDEEPTILSRQAKYNKKSSSSDKASTNNQDVYHEQDDVESSNQYNEEPQVDPKELKAQRKREKAEIRAKKKEKRKAYNQRMKEKRKNQPSAVSQRRMNYEERRQMFSDTEKDMRDQVKQDHQKIDENDNQK
ncbi:lipoteichoic acid stability factor AuxB [Staphylococcus warneri]